MNKHNIKPRLLFALLSSLALIACGGDTDGNGNSSVPSINKLQLSGQAIDAPLANAEIIADVGGKTFKTQADKDGKYALTIETPNAQDMIVLTAQGVGAQAKIKLDSLLGSFAGVQKLAGSDAILEISESESIRISHISTATAALVRQQLSDKQPDTQDKLNDVLLSIDPEALSQIATMIKLVADYAVPLPNGVSNTVELAKNGNALIAFQINPKWQDAQKNVNAEQAKWALLNKAAPPPQLRLVQGSKTNLMVSELWDFNFESNGKTTVRGAFGEFTGKWSQQENGLIKIVFDQGLVDSRGTTMYKDEVLDQECRALTMTVALAAGNSSWGRVEREGKCFYASNPTVSKDNMIGKLDADQPDWNRYAVVRRIQSQGIPVSMADFKLGQRIAGLPARSPDENQLNVTGIAGIAKIESAQTLSWEGQRRSMEWLADGAWHVQTEDGKAKLVLLEQDLSLGLQRWKFEVPGGKGQYALTTLKVDDRVTFKGVDLARNWLWQLDASDTSNSRLYYQMASDGSADLYGRQYGDEGGEDKYGFLGLNAKWSYLAEQDQIVWKHTKTSFYQRERTFVPIAKWGDSLIVFYRLNYTFDDGRMNNMIGRTMRLRDAGPSVAQKPPLGAP